MHGIFISIAILAPNILMLTNPPQSVPPKLAMRSGSTLYWMRIVERIGQAMCFIIPLGYVLRPDAPAQWAGVAVMIAALALYYTGWARFMRGGYRFRLLFEPMARIPVPMAVAPVVYFLAAAVALMSAPLAVAAVLLTAGHLFVSWTTWKHVEVSPEMPPPGEAAAVPAPDARAQRPAAPNAPPPPGS